MQDVMDKSRSKFLGLSDEALDELTDAQRGSYNKLRDASDELTAADAEALDAGNDLHFAADVLRAAHEDARLKPKWTFRDEHAAMVRQRQLDRGIR